MIRAIVGFGFAAAIAVFVILWTIYLIVGFVIVSGISLLAWALGEGLPEVIGAGVLALITAAILFYQGRLRLRAITPVVEHTREGQDTHYV